MIIWINESHVDGVKLYTCDAFYSKNYLFIK